MYMYKYKGIDIYIYIRIYMCMHIHMYIYKRIYIYKYTYMQTYSHIDIIYRYIIYMNINKLSRQETPNSVGGQNDTRLVAVMMMTMTHR